MMRIAALDDEIHVLERFERMIKHYKDIELCGLFEDGEQLLSYLKNHSVDAIFLDIEMPGINGLEISSRILDLNIDISVVFVTAYNQYAIEAFEVEAMDYILKPLSEARLKKALGRLSKNKKSLALALAVGVSGKVFIQCMGGFEMFIGKEPVVWKNSKAKEIFAFLVQNNGMPADWEKVADAVWPNYNAKKAQTNFHATTYLLRKKLKEVGLSHIIENGRGNYRILKDEVECDFYQLEKLINSNMIKRKEDMQLVEKLDRFGYMEASGYQWAQPKAAELEKECQRIMKAYNKIK